MISKHSKSRYYFILMTTIILLLLCIVYIGSIENKSDLSLNAIASSIGAPIPVNAINVENYSQSGREGFISLKFNAPPESALNFTRYICQGILHDGYDPFKAIDTIEPLPDVHLIKMRRFTYYSYSPNVPKEILGNRCWNPIWGIEQLQVDTTNNDLYEVQFVTSSWDCLKFPCRELGKNYIQPVADISPLIVIGMQNINQAYVLVSDEVCIEMQLGYGYSEISWSRNSKWSHLIDAEVELTIDDEIIISAIIDGTRILIPITKDQGDPLTTNLFTNEDYGYYNTCFMKDFNAGKHHAAIRITLKTGTESNYLWDFYSE